MKVYELCNDEGITIAIFKTLEAAKKFNDDFSKEKDKLYDKYLDMETTELTIPEKEFDRKLAKLMRKYNLSPEQTTNYLDVGNYDTICETDLRE